MNEEMIPVHLDDEMNFGCSPDVSCFNDCCRDLNQALTPYDVLRLKNNLNLASGLFLKKYTSSHIGPESGLPVVTFKPDPATGHLCPFVSPEGCSVYPDRPASCRLYPLARAVARSRQTGEVTEFFALIEEPHCRGFGQNTGQTVRAWLAGQDLALHNQMNDRLMEVLSLKNRIMPGRLDPVDSARFYLACYDLDAFRSRITEDGLPAGLDVPSALVDRLATDDTSLLDFGYIWIAYTLFGVTLDIRGGQGGY
ncbi:MAG: YkgJ family cysteine cluster protein [Desulfobacterium sp.]|jgi:Fe-S-cluster containining protein|nr:YkgJ family cysteine cluster protein [Desulfobacterium sp.]